MTAVQDEGTLSATAATLLEKIRSRRAVVGVVGLGCVDRKRPCITSGQNAIGNDDDY